MSLQTRLQDLTTRIATEFKTVYSRQGALGSLSTTVKTDLVSAINEVQSAAANATGINDAATATTTTWSSSKINTQINAAVPTWATLSGKPATFAPTIGTTATTAKAGNYVPAWTEVTGKPTFAAVATSGAYADLSGIPATFAPIIGTTATTAKAGNYVPTWAEITSKPTTFAPIIGTTPTTAKAGDYTPSWAEVSGKPSFAAVATTGSYADMTGTIPTSALPPLAITKVNTVATQAAMLALTAEEGDVAIRTDTSQTFILAAEPATTLANWKLLETPVGVTTVAGRSGAVVLTKADVGLNNVDNTSDASKPVSTATQTALNAKANTTHTHTTNDLTDASSVGKSVLTAATTTAARTAIGAGTSDLTIGTTGTTAAAGNHTHVAANITDTTTTGRAVMTAASTTAARTAIGAGTSNLVIGNTAGTAQDSAAVGDTEVNLVAIFEAALAA